MDWATVEHPAPPSLFIFTPAPTLLLILNIVIFTTVLI